MGCVLQAKIFSQDVCGTAFAFLSGNIAQRAELAFSRTHEWAGVLFPLRKWVICQQESHLSANSSSFIAELLCGILWFQMISTETSNGKFSRQCTDNVLCPEIQAWAWRTGTFHSFCTSSYRGTRIKHLWLPYEVTLVRDTRKSRFCF